METPAVINAEWWVDFWETVEHWAFLGVVLTLAIEFAATHFMKAPRKVIDDARQLEVAQLKNDADTARLQTEQLKQIVAWRSLSNETAAKLLSELSKKTGAVNVLYTDSDPEALFFAGQFRRALISAGWASFFFAYKSSSIVIGIAIPGDDSGDTKALREAFSAAGVPFSVEMLNTGAAAISSGDAVLTSFSQPMPPGVKLFIGSRPPVVPQ
jgi:hypothetical protein